MTTIAAFTTGEDAHLFRSFLGSRGIEAHVLDEHMIQLFWQYSDALGGVRVVVDDSEVEDARLAHKEYMAGLRSGPYPVAPVRAWPVVVLLSVAMGLPFLVFGRSVSRASRK